MKFKNRVLRKKDIEKISRKERFNKLKERKKLFEKIKKTKYNPDVIDFIFRRLYNISYYDILQVMLPTFMPRTKVFDYILSLKKSKHLILFPLKGSLFNYYFVKGIVKSLKEHGEAKNLEVRTILLKSNDIYFGKNYIAKLQYQLDKILKDKDFESYSVYDYFNNEFNSKSLRQIRDAMRKYNLNYYWSFKSFQHQVIYDKKNKGYVPYQLIKKQESPENGLMKPNFAAFYKKYINKDLASAEALTRLRTIKNALFYAGKITMDALYENNMKIRELIKKYSNLPNI